MPGAWGREGTVDTSAKDSTDLWITNLSRWKEEDGVFFNSLKEHHMLYLENGAWRETYRPGIGDLSDSGYQIQRTRPGSDMFGIMILCF